MGYSAGHNSNCTFVVSKCCSLATDGLSLRQSQEVPGVCSRAMGKKGTILYAICYSLYANAT